VGCVTPRQALFLFLLFFAVFAANYQPSTSRFPQKSWTADNLANERTAGDAAVLLLFSLFLSLIRKDREGGTTIRNKFTTSLDVICMLKSYHDCVVLSNSYPA